MLRKYFGTDGIRGRVGEFPLTPEFVLKLGYAVGKALGQRGRKLALIGKDTRQSGFMFASAMSAGFSAAGVNVINVGVMPTPAIAFLTRKYEAQVGVVVSASHNPYYDNGIKLFSDRGEKLSDEVELEIERLIDEKIDFDGDGAIGSYRDKGDVIAYYSSFCKSALAGSSLDLSGMKIVLDCANGAMYQVAPGVVQSLGADVVQLYASPNGMNINKSCGAVYTQNLQKAVIDMHADLGIAFDGDGDRVMMVASDGTLIDGDGLLYILASFYKEIGVSFGGVVGTVMTNLGYELAFKKCGISFSRAKVGDRYVLEQMNQRKWLLGGEASGHIICKDVNTTGDGLVAAIRVLQAVSYFRKPLSELIDGVQRMPQCMINVSLKNKITESELRRYEREAESVSDSLGDKGRVVLRPSGTEPVLRVMVEALDEDVAKVQAEKLAKIVSG